MQFHFVLTEKSLRNIQEFYKTKNVSIKCGSEAIGISKDLSILFSLALYQSFHGSADTYQIDMSRSMDDSEASTVICLKKIISMTEMADTAIFEKSEVQVLNFVSKALRNAEIRRQVEALSSFNGPIQLHWNSGLLSEFGFERIFKEFCFQVGEVKFECPKILALLLSKEAFEQNLANSSMVSYHVNLIDGINNGEFISAFDKVFDLLSGNQLIIPYQKREIFEAVASAIGCEELLYAIKSFAWDSRAIDDSNVNDHFMLRTLQERNEMLQKDILILREKSEKIIKENKRLREVDASLKEENQTLRQRIEEEQNLNSKHGSQKLRENEILSQKQKKDLENKMRDFLNKCVVNGNIVVRLKSHEYNGSIEIQEGIEKIETEAFRESRISSVKLPNTLTEIGESAFFNCSSLLSIIIPSNVTQICDYSFRNCSSLSSRDLYE